MKDNRAAWFYLSILIGVFVLFSNSCKKVEDANKTDSSTVKDIDGNQYSTIKIGTQVWMAENLKTTKYQNGDIIGTTPIPTTDISAEATPSYQWPVGGDESNVATYGRLYTWYTVTDSRNVCLTGWHVPTDTELEALKTYLGGESVAGGKLKETGTTHWQTPNTGATNETGFTALAGGYRLSTGGFVSLSITFYLWSSSQNTLEWGWGQGLHYNDGILLSSGYWKNNAVSVRCLKD